ncbi:TIGR02679 family protein [Cupriavidus basilensis]
MATTRSDRLYNLLGRPEHAGLRERLRRRYATMPPGDEPKSVRLTNLTPSEQEAVRFMLGRTYGQTGSITMDIVAVDRAIRAAGLGASLRHVLEEVDGPIINLAEARQSSRAAWSDVVERASERVKAIAQESGGVALLKRLSKGDPPRAVLLCDHAARVLARLPANGLSLAKLAADTLGDAHALDRGQALATLVLAVLRHGIFPSNSGAQVLDDNETANQNEAAIERSRDVWGKAGIVVNEMAKPVLHLNLPARPSEQSVFRPGEPGFFSWRQLDRDRSPFDVRGRAVFICENANVVSFVADQLGAHCAPLVCIDGMPGAAQRLLLTYLQRDGASLFYHGDFDWEGIRIANHVVGPSVRGRGNSARGIIWICWKNPRRRTLWQAGRRSMPPGNTG